MYLKGNPFDIKGNIFYYGVDNSLANVTEWSDVIEKDADHDRLSFIVRNLQLYNTILSPFARYSKQPMASHALWKRL